MRRVPFLGFSVALLLVALAAPVSAATPFLDAQQEKGSSAQADGGICVDDVPEVGDYTCDYSYAFAFDGWSRYNGDRFRGTRLCVGTDHHVYDASARIETSTFTGGCLEGADVTFASALASASAAGTVTLSSDECVYDLDNDTYECTDPVPAGFVVVDLDWTGIGSVSKGTSRYRDQYEACTSTGYNKGTSNEATVSGMIGADPASFSWANLTVGTGRWTYACH